MSIIYKTGDLFEMIDEVDVVVNTVNCFGVMGKGIALTFKEKYPDMYKSYRKKCENKELTVGTLDWYEIPNKNKDYEQEDLFSKPKKSTAYILNFPTKNHWRGGSKIQYIKDGLNEIVRYLRNRKDIDSIAMPPLGCGHGGLDWSEVKPLIEKTFNEYLPSVELYLFEPNTQ